VNVFEITGSCSVLSPLLVWIAITSTSTGLVNTLGLSGTDRSMNLGALPFLFSLKKPQC
jgi:hypothetical protein